MPVVIPPLPSMPSWCPSLGLECPPLYIHSSVCPHGVLHWVQNAHRHTSTPQYALMVSFIMFRMPAVVTPLPSMPSWCPSMGSECPRHASTSRYALMVSTRHRTFCTFTFRACATLHSFFAIFLHLSSSHSFILSNRSFVFSFLYPLCTT